MVRHIYMDEGGRSKITDEPFCVEAAVIADLDAHLRPVSERFAELAAAYLPTNSQNVPFSAKNIWHGTKDFHRDRLTRANRFELLRELAKIPGEFSILLCVVPGAVTTCLRPGRLKKIGSI
jgi:hypothetical protein